FQAEDGIRDDLVTGVQTCALPISAFAVSYHLSFWSVISAGLTSGRTGMRWLSLAGSVALLCSVGVAHAESPTRGPLVFKGARIYTIAGPVIENGLLVVDGGKIHFVGPAPEGLQLPDNATVHDVTGKVIIPGLVDTHSHIGIYARPHVNANQDGNEMTGAAQPGLRALDAIYPDDPGIRMAVAG